jgi:hypothetical protein
MAIIKLAPNVPESIELRYVDVKIGTYGPQLQLKGRGKDGQDRVIYVPVDCAAGLVKAGASMVETEKGQTYKPVSGWWVAEKRQAAGSKYATTYLYPEGQAPEKPAPQPLTEKPVQLQQPPEPMPWDPSSNPKDGQAVALFWDSFDKVLEGVARRKLSDLFKPENLAALTATLYIQRSKIG